MREDLIELAAKVEAADGPDRALNREVALAVGWVRQSPSEAGRRHPAWFHPSDCRNGKPVMDSLHGTEVWREPLDYLGSLDAAMTLVPEGWCYIEFRRFEGGTIGCDMEVIGVRVSEISASAATIENALTAAALRALGERT